MEKMRTIIVTLSIIFGAVPSALASDKYTLTGAITGVRANVWVKDGKVIERSFSLTVSLQLQNLSDEPLILFVPDRVPASRKLEFLSPSGSVGDVATVAQRYPPQFFSDRLERFFEALVKKPEPRDDTVVVPPLRYYQFTEILSFASGYEIDEEAILKAYQQRRKYVQENPWAMSRLDDEPRQSSAKIKGTKFPSIRIEYRLSSGKFTAEPQLLSLVQTRWRRFGHLPINNGDYLLLTDPIPNDPRFIP